MRALIKSCSDADVEAMRGPFNALGALEQIALHAPENSGRLRSLQFELRDALAQFSAGAGDTSISMRIEAALRDVIEVLNRPRGVIAGERQNTPVWRRAL